MTVSHIFGPQQPQYRSVTASAHGKVNLHLGVGPAREDGYHELDTIFQAVSLKEEVTVALRDAQGAQDAHDAEAVREAEVAQEAADAAPCTWSVSGFDSHLVPQDSSNLAWKAVAAIQKLARDAHVPWADAPVHIHIDKGIPVAGGMAGGSADAAAALVAATELYFPDLRSPRRPDGAQLSGIAADLGADVPFCLLGGTARGTGKGENLMPVIATGTYHWAIATDKRGLSTPEVFRQLDQQRAAASEASPKAARAGSPEGLIAALRTGNPEEVGKLLVNDLQAPAISLLPSLRETLKAAEEAGAIAAIVSGSGPTVAMLCASADDAVEVATAVSVAGKASSTMTTSSPAAAAGVIKREEVLE